VKKQLAFSILLLVSGVLVAQNLSVENPLASSTGQPAPSSPAASSSVANQADLQMFGYQLFTQQKMSDETPQGSVLPPGYRLGPGDRVAIFLGGKTHERFEVTVTVDGKIYVPTVGVLNVQGMEFDRFHQVLDQALRRYYSNYQLELMLLQPKSIRVAVLGQVVAPGYVTLGGFGTVLDALVSAQGPTPCGSLRNIRIYRADSAVAVVDLYQLLLNPQQNEQVLLQNGDRIFIPDVEHRVVVQGEVKRSAIYELRDLLDENAGDLIQWAGGPTDLAYLDKIELSRQNADGSRSVYYFSLTNSADSISQRPLKNLDSITLYNRSQQLPLQQVTLYGEVQKPGVYPLEQNMRVSDLILKAGNLLRSAYMLQAEVAKVDPQSSPTILTIDLAAVMAGEKPEEDILLDADDQIFIRRIPQWQVGPTVEVTGEVLFPGAYTIVRDSTTLSDILRQTGGFTADALLPEAKLIRRHVPAVEDKEYERLKEMTRDQMSNAEYEYFVMKQNTSEIREIVVDFYKLMITGDRSEDVVLLNGDQIVIPQKPNTVMVTGRVGRAGGILYKPGADLKYYVARAGGYTWDADSRRIKVIKASGEAINDEDVVSFDPGDRVWVPRKRDRTFWRTFGEVMTTLYQLATIYLVIDSVIE